MHDQFGGEASTFVLHSYLGADILIHGANKVEDLRRFFDHYLKGADNGWEQTPRVRYAILDFAGGDRTSQPARAFPPEGVTLTKYYLDGRSRTLRTAPPAEAALAAYDVEGAKNLVPKPHA